MKNKWNKYFTKYTYIFLFLVFVAFLNLFLGSVYIEPLYILQWAIGKSSNEAWDTILLNYRLPRLITAMLAGSALSVSGLQMQTLFKNPIASPYLLGISAGASFGVAMVLLADKLLQDYFHILPIQNSISITLAATIGAFSIMGLMLVFAQRFKNNMMLLLVGLMLGIGINALISILQYYSNANAIKNFVIWHFGSINNLMWEEIWILIPIIILSIFMAFVLSKALNLLLLGEDYAQSLGIKQSTIRVLIVLNSGIMTAFVTAFCGPIGFLGLVVPHVARLFFKSSNHRILTPACALLGATFLTFFGILSELPFTNYVLPINIVTSLLGAPFVVWLLIKNAKTNGL